jgi:queuine/archaeosine tRNA-ribosyltransferase
MKIRKRYSKINAISIFSDHNNHLVANFITLHNLNAMTKVIKQLKRAGIEMSPELMAGLSPYRTSHINLLGQY